MDLLLKEIEKPLANKRQEIFCQEYMKDLNGTRAAIRAGYSEKTANEQAARLLAQVSIRTRIQSLMKKRSTEILIDAKYVVDNLRLVAERCMQASPVLVWDPRSKEMVQKQDEDGNPVWQFDSVGANRALELLGKHLAMFTDTVHNKHTIEQPLFGPGTEPPKQLPPNT